MSGRLSTSTKVDELKSYLSDIGITTIQCEKLTTRHDHFASFRVSYNQNEKKSLLEAELWPELEGTVVRRFYRKRSIPVQEGQRKLNSDPLGTNSTAQNGSDNK